MKISKKLAAVAVTVMIAASSMIYFSAAPVAGSSDDPIITLSYLKTQINSLQSQINSLKGNSGTTVPTGNTGSTGKKGQITASALNVRSAGSLNGKVIGTVTKNATVDILETGNGWYRIKNGNVTGWVSSDYVKLN